MRRIAEKSTLTIVFVIMTLLLGNDASGTSIVHSKHNLSVTGPGPITAVKEERICIFCHMPPVSRTPIPSAWNRRSTVVSYTPYRSSTLKANAGQPTGASRICLSCHDGTIALGALVSEPQEISFRGGIRFMPAHRPSRLGTDLSDDHPVSFVYNARLAAEKGELADPSMLPPQVVLDSNGELQCTACHDPHDDTYGKFLVMSNEYSKLCTTCHIMDGWAACSHATSPARWNGQGADPWTNSAFRTVAENGCENCHRPHTAGKRERLLKYNFEEDNCLVCHNGSVASTNIEMELTKPYVHPVQDYTGEHNPVENFSFGNVPTHVECEDCHNPHQANEDPASGALSVGGANKAVVGIGASGQQVPEAYRLYEICFKCHADNNVIRRLPVTRQVDQLNTRLQFDPSNPSFHPVESIGVNPDVPSLLLPYTVNSIISCTDCHNNSDVAGPQGPHGSEYEYLLVTNYITNDFTQETSFSYALCYTCHSRNSILRDESFAQHYSHVVNETAPCSICHDPHGVSAIQGNAFNNSHLINFDLTSVQPDAQGRLYFEDSGRLSGRCYLTCHGETHDPKEYGP